MSNCLGFRCPNCVGRNRIDIKATVWIRATPDGTCAELSHRLGHYFSPDSAARCAGCGQSARLREFMPPEMSC